MSETSRLLEETAAKLFGQWLSDPIKRQDPDLAANIAGAAEEAGLALTLRGEAEGGMGAGLAEAAVIAWQAGYHAAPIGVVSLLLAPVLGLNEAVALAAPDRDSAEGPAARIALMRGDQLQLYRALPAFEALDHRPWLRAEGPALASHPLPRPAAQIAAWGGLLTAATMLGLMTRICEMVIDYSQTRKQFGRNLAAFQAIQHRIAEAASEVTVAQAAVAGAIAAEDGGWARPILWQSAKVQSGRAASRLAAAAHQILGAIGFTQEHELHHYTKKLWVLRDAWGRQSSLETAIAEAAVAAPQGLWSHLVDSPPPQVLSKGEAA